MPLRYENQTHQGEEGDRKQRVVLDDAEHPQRQGLKEAHRQQAHLDADEAEHQPRCR